MADGLLIVIVIVVAGVAWAQLRAKERARAAGRAACERAGAQFLDDTVALQGIRLRRNAYGGLWVHRDYSFDFTFDGATRYHGRVELFGDVVRAVELESRQP